MMKSKIEGRTSIFVKRTAHIWVLMIPGKIESLKGTLSS